MDIRLDILGRRRRHPTKERGSHFRLFLEWRKLLGLLGEKQYGLAVVDLENGQVKEKSSMTSQAKRGVALKTLFTAPRSWAGRDACSYSWWLGWFSSLMRTRGHMESHNGMVNSLWMTRRYSGRQGQ